MAHPNGIRRIPAGLFLSNFDDRAGNFLENFKNIEVKRQKNASLL
jgi:hypothetical protein